MSGADTAKAYDYHVLDVFTEQRRTGNPLAVVLQADTLDEAQLQPIAREFNLSETVFVLKPRAGGLTRVRIFTPTVELPFAGHPTVGSACLLADLGRVADGAVVDIVLEEAIGPVPVRLRRAAGRPVHAQLTTAVLPHFGPVAAPAELARRLGLERADLETSTEAPRGASCGVAYNLVPLRSRSALGRARRVTEAEPPTGPAPWSTSYYPYCRGDAPGLIHARMFSADLGVGEDPATGSAAAALAGHLADTDPRSDGTLSWTIRQGEDMGRPSSIEIEADKQAGRITAVRVGGYAVRVAAGRLFI